MQPAARVDDTHKCDKHGGDKIIEGSPNIFINGKPAARVGDHAMCKTGEKTKIKSGSNSVLFNGKSAARLNDPTDHDGKIASGSSNVMIGSGGNAVNFGNNGTINIGGNGNAVNIGQAALSAAEIIGGIPLDEVGVGEEMQADGVRRIIITVEEITNKSRTEIRALAEKKGLKAAGDKSDPDYPRKWKDPNTGEKRLRLDRGHVDDDGNPYNNPATAGVDHAHGYDSEGNPIRNFDGDKHFPTTGN
jgi:uncharacterized Zn-binding protein involved in type VI secretion